MNVPSSVAVRYGVASPPMAIMTVGCPGCSMTFRTTRYGPALASRRFDRHLLIDIAVSVAATEISTIARRMKADLPLRGSESAGATCFRGVGGRVVPFKEL